METNCKKSAIAGEYIVQVKNDGGIEVFRIYDNVKGGLKEAAESVGFEYDSNWTTHQFGAKLIKEYGSGKMANVGNFVVSVADSGSIELYRSYENTKEALREIAGKVGFEYDSNWNTRQFGSKLIDFITK